MPDTEMPKETARSAVEKLGLLRIRGYDAVHDVNIRDFILQDTRIVTDLDIMLESGEAFPVRFNSYVGYELSGHRVKYTEITDKMEGSLGGKRATQDTVVKELVPLENELPKYKATDVRMVCQ